MARAQRSVLREGLITGIIGASVVAVWFLIFDIVRGTPLFTPALLGAAAFYGVNSPIGLSIAAGPILGYTVLHGLAFVTFGLIAASVMRMGEREPTLLVAFMILFACFEVFFFAVLGAWGTSMLGALAWWAVLVGNVLASVAMLWFLARAHPGLPAALFGSWGNVFREGMMAGLLGAAVVAMWFLVLDWIQGEPLRTPILLGTALLKATGPLAAVLSYTVFHGLAFILFGIVGAGLLAGAERQPMFIFLLAIVFTAFEVFFFGAVIIAAKWVLDEVAGWAIFAGNILATTVMLAYYLTGHRALAHRMREAFAEDD